MVSPWSARRSRRSGEPTGRPDHRTKPARACRRLAPARQWRPSRAGRGDGARMRAPFPRVPVDGCHCLESGWGGARACRICNIAVPAASRHPGPVTETGLRERKKQETRAAIAQAALALAAEHGPDGVTVDDIAAAADVSPRTVFNHFG